MKRLASIVAALTLAAVLGNSTPVHAAPNGKVVCTWEVQVQYWFFDTTGYYWSAYYKSTNQQAANFVYTVLKGAKANGTLNKVAPNSAYWRWIAVDVRLVKKCKVIPIPTLTPQRPINPIGPVTKPNIRRIPIPRPYRKPGIKRPLRRVPARVNPVRVVPRGTVRIQKVRRVRIRPRVPTIR